MQGSSNKYKSFLQILEFSWKMVRVRIQNSFCSVWVEASLWILSFLVTPNRQVQSSNISSLTSVQPLLLLFNYIKFSESNICLFHRK